MDLEVLGLACPVLMSQTHTALVQPHRPEEVHYFNGDKAINLPLYNYGI